MPEPTPEPTPASVPEPAEDPWRVAFVEFKTRDEKMVKDYQEEIDTLLVFAGLFSAVLTAFVVESYQSLQEDYTQTSAELLRQISQQLANSSYPAAPDTSQFQVQRSDVRVNVCWFVSLLLSLVVALFGIFLKQWMRSYIRWTDVTPDQEAVALRQFRYHSLETWRLAAILALLPTLLQLSVIVFLSGLLVFLSSLDRTVAIVMIALTSVAFFLVAAVTFLPVVSWTCPYRFPLSEVLALSLWRVTGVLKFIGHWELIVIRGVWARLKSNRSLSDSLNPKLKEWDELAGDWLVTPRPTSWVQADQGAIARYNISSKHHAVSMHVSAMVHLCCTTQSQSLWSAALTAIAAVQDPLDSPVPVSGSTDIFYNKVWGPVVRHIGLGTKDEWIYRRLFHAVSSQSTCFSSSMKQCWANFVMHSKRFISQSDTPFVDSYMTCCLASIESATGGSYMRAFMQVLEAQHANLQEDQLRCIVWCLNESMDPRNASVLLDSLSDIKFVERVKNICNGLSATHTITQDHRYLLDVLAMLACRVAMTTTDEPHGRVPRDLEDIMHAIQHHDDDALINPLYRPSSRAVRVCAPALILVARHDPDRFPKRFARVIVHRLAPLELWNIACGVEGLDVEGIDVARITNDDSGQDYLWESLDTCTPDVVELLIAPHTFSLILDAYEKQVEQDGLANMQL